MTMIQEIKARTQCSKQDVVFKRYLVTTQPKKQKDLFKNIDCHFTNNNACHS